LGALVRRPAELRYPIFDLKSTVDTCQPCPDPAPGPRFEAAPDRQNRRTRPERFPLNFVPNPVSEVSIQPKRLKRGRLGIPEEDWIHMLDDVASNLKEASLVFQWDQCALSAIVHCELQRLSEGP
jgi:hypothetical protein